MDDYDPHLSDAELFARFTPKQLGFYQWQTEMEAEGGDDRYRRARVDQKFPGAKEFEEYGDWIDLWYGRYHRRMRYRMPVNEFIDLVQQTRFNNHGSNGTLLWHMNMGTMPFIYLGWSSFGGKPIGYGIEPGGYCLWPNVDATPGEPGILERNVLGINTDVRVGDGNPSALSSPGRGYTFAQIGALCVFADNWEEEYDSTVNEIIDSTWEYTNFGVVVQVGCDAKLGAIWVIWNAFRPDEWDTSKDRKYMPTADSNGRLLPRVGRLHDDSNEQFIMAKLADSLDHLREPREDFTFDVMSKHEHQLVRAKLFGDQAYIHRRNIIKTPQRPRR
ncbi:hypothetical protein OCS_01191 [Ophiocordyceps sinensis CO18]|uniref:Uncharacterized protein n=1 Tax=Ophiocordyceps sinensis (strain Co18 / CGMCC 3.14243) TaxID=911162 RepID=T5AL03_OPHSC|nr:hypothetical protein OCS_01191 [Ophiocordyceps sinensis CO18]